MTQPEGADFVSVLRTAAPYVHSHHGRTFVVAFGGEACARPDFEHLIYDIALLHSLGVKLVLVHGARPRIEEELQRRGLSPHYVGDLRVTDPTTMECVKSAVGTLRMDIESKLSAGLASTPMGGARLKVAGGNWITARPVGIRQGVDHQLTGEVRRIDHESLNEVLCNGRIALLSPIGYSPSGEAFNLRTGEVAQAVAAAIGADKLLFVLEQDPRQLRFAAAAGDAGQLPLDEAERILSESPKAAELTEEDRGYVESALAAARAGVRRVHMLGSDVRGGLLRELYTRDGCGLMVYADQDYESIHGASVEDIGGILNLIQPLEAAGILVPRSREQLEIEIDRFIVMDRDGVVIGCVALLPMPGTAAAEFACLSVQPEYRGHGRAGQLLDKAESRARELGITELYTLTTHTPHWFIEHGFTRVEPDALPVERKRLYNYTRNSAVLRKSL